MIVHIFTIVFSLLTVEIIQHFKLFHKFKHCLQIVSKISHTILSKKISDHWKEKTLLKYSQLLLLSSLQVFGILVIIIILYFIITYFHQPFSSHLISLIGAVETTLIIMAYVYIRKFIYAKL